MLTADTKAFNKSIFKKKVEARINAKLDLEAGFFEEAKYTNGTPVATVAVLNEYGTSKIPPRPFFRLAIDENQKKWLKQFKQVVKQGASVEDALNIVGTIMKDDIADSITDLQSPPNAQSTIDAKGSSNPLMNTGFMASSATYKVTK